MLCVRRRSLFVARCASLFVLVVVCCLLFWRLLLFVGSCVCWLLKLVGVFCVSRVVFRCAVCVVGWLLFVSRLFNVVVRYVSSTVVSYVLFVACLLVVGVGPMVVVCVVFLFIDRRLLDLGYFPCSALFVDCWCLKVGCRLLRCVSFVVVRCRLLVYCRCVFCMALGFYLLLFVVGCLSCVVCFDLIACCLVLVVYSALFVVRCLWCVVCRLMFVGCWCLADGRCLRCVS